MSFLTPSNIKINFTNHKLNERLYITIQILLTTKPGELVRKNKFAMTAFDLDNKIFMIHITLLTSSNLNIHPSCRAYIDLLI